MKPENHDNPDFWIPDYPDGSGWAEVNWSSVTRGSRYHYRHADPIEIAEASRPPFYKVVTRLETERIIAHENTYYVSALMFADFVGELVWHGGDEVIWHIEPSPEPPPEAKARPGT